MLHGTQQLANFFASMLKSGEARVICNVQHLPRLVLTLLHRDSCP